MDGKTRFLILPLVVAMCVLATPAPVNSQCNVTNTMTTLPTSPMIFVTKTFSMSEACATTAMNAASCFPGSAVFTQTMLYAVANPTTMAPYCNWSCGCGTGAPPHVTINGPDNGLPVELMDFSIEGEES